MLLIVIILYTSDTPTAPILQCSHFLNSEATFTVTINVTITQYIAFENVVNSVSIIPELFEYGKDRTDQDSYALIQKSVKVCLNLFFCNKSYIVVFQPNTTNLVYYISENFHPKSTANYEYRFSVNTVVLLCIP